MGCVCCSLSTFISGILHALERMSFCTICACFIYCMLFTILAVLVVGVGVGFHYCLVQSNIDAMARAAKAARQLRSGPVEPVGPVMRSVDSAMRRGTFNVDSSRDRERRDLAIKLLQNNALSTIRNTTNPKFNVTQDKLNSTLEKIKFTKMTFNTTNVNLLRYFMR